MIAESSMRFFFFQGKGGLAPGWWSGGRRVGGRRSGVVSELGWGRGGGRPLGRGGGGQQKGLEGDVLLFGFRPGTSDGLRAGLGGGSRGVVCVCWGSVEAHRRRCRRGCSLSWNVLPLPASSDLRWPGKERAVECVRAHARRREGKGSALGSLVRAPTYVYWCVVPPPRTTTTAPRRLQSGGGRGRSVSGGTFPSGDDAVSPRLALVTDLFASGTPQRVVLPRTRTRETPPAPRLLSP